MTTRILVAMDESPQAEAALDHALETYPKAEITVLYVLDPIGHWSEGAPYPDHLGDWYAELEAHANRLFERASERARESEMELRTETRRGKPAREIIAHAVDGAFDGIVLGSHGRNGLSRVLLGSVAEDVVRRSPVPATVVR